MVKKLRCLFLLSAIISSLFVELHATQQISEQKIAHRITVMHYAKKLGSIGAGVFFLGVALYLIFYSKKTYQWNQADGIPLDTSKF